MSRKMLLLDIDGTTTGKQGVPQSAVDAIHRARENGAVIAFFTGRPFKHIDKEVLDIGFDGFISTMGAQIRADGEVICDRSIPADVKDGVIAAVRKHHVDAAYEYATGIAFDNRVKSGFFLLGKLREVFGAKGLETEADIESPDFRFEKLTVWYNEGADEKGFEEEISNYLDIVGKKQNMAEFSAKGISPHESTLELMKHFGIRADDCYAFGDSINDMPFLSCAANTCAMGEASEEMKQQVSYVTAGLYEDGLAKAIEHFGLI